jgi:MFS family permease
MIPFTLGFVVMGPLSGHLSDRYGARPFMVIGTIITALAFLALSYLPYDFSYLPFAIIIFVMGLGGGLFAAPNTAAVMNAVPPENRGAASGLRATLQNTGQTISIAVFFTIIVTGLSSSLPSALSNALTNAGVSQLSSTFASIPPTSALFAAFLGDNPVKAILAMPQLTSVVAQIPQLTLANLEGQTFFPKAIAPAFISALDLSFYIGAGLSAAAAVASLVKGEQKVNPTRVQTLPIPAPEAKPNALSRSVRMDDKAARSSYPDLEGP